MTTKETTMDFHHSESAAAIRANRAERNATTAELDAHNAALDAMETPNVRTITNAQGTWLERDLASSLAGELADIRDGLEELQARFERVMGDVRALPGGELQWQRVDAYPGTRLDRDMGAGKGPSEWIEEVGTFLEEEVLGR
jgi:hypothetical protein